MIFPLKGANSTGNKQAIHSIQVHFLWSLELIFFDTTGEPRSVSASINSDKSSYCPSFCEIVWHVSIFSCRSAFAPVTHCRVDAMKRYRSRLFFLIITCLKLLMVEKKNPICSKTVIFLPHFGKLFSMPVRTLGADHSGASV